VAAVLVVNHMRRISGFFLHVVLIAFACCCLFSLRKDLTQLSLTTLVNSWGLVVMAAALSLANYALRILRWRYFLARLGHRLPYRFTALTYCAGFAYTLSPGKFGEMLRARYYAPLGVPLPAVTAAFFSERLMDLVAMTGLASLIFTISRRFDGAIGVAAVIVTVALGMIALIPWSTLAASIESWPGLPSAVRPALAGFATALASTRTLLSPTVLIAGFCFGLLAWGVEGAGLSLLSSMFRPAALSLTAAIGIYAAAVLIGALSFLPGGLGSTEAAMTGLLVANGHLLSDALLLTLSCRLVTLWLAVGLGWGAVWLLRERPTLAVQPWK
jgi:uncharacterized protein (TIRG00374 family)